jgi:excisionase family DNA binding protein
MNCTKLLSIGKTAEILGVHIETLREWDKEGKLTPVKTFGGHRRYRLEDIEAFCGEVKEKNDDAKAVRVATKENPENSLKEQVFFGDNTIIVCLPVDTLRCWRDKGVFDLIGTIGGHSVEELMGGFSEKSSKMD